MFTKSFAKQYLNEQNKATKHIKKRTGIVVEDYSEEQWISFLLELNQRDSAAINEILLNIVALWRGPIAVLFVILLKIKTTEEVQEILERNDFEILKKAGISLFNFCQKNKDLSLEFANLVHSIVGKNKEAYISGCAEKILLINDKSNHALILSTLVQIYEKELANEGIGWLEIKHLTEKHSYSNVVEIGSKVIKAGRRVVTTLPQDKRILTPSLRVELGCINPSLKGFIEVSEKVEMTRNLSREDLYLVYGDLRSRGIIWTDVQPLNVGKLVNAKIQRGENDAQIGEWVIIDQDYIYYENDPNITWCHGNEVYEKQYQRGYCRQI